MSYDAAMTYAQLVKHFGSVRAAAAALGISHQAIYVWGKNKSIPERAQRHVQAETRGKLKVGK